MTETRYARARSASSAQSDFARNKPSRFPEDCARTPPRKVDIMVHLRDRPLPIAGRAAADHGKRSRKSAYVNFRPPRPPGQIAPVTEERSLARARKVGEPTIPRREPRGRSDLPRTPRACLDAFGLRARAREGLARGPCRGRARSPADVPRRDDAHGDQPRARRRASPQAPPDRTEALPALRLAETAVVGSALPAVSQAEGGAS